MTYEQQRLRTMLFLAQRLASRMRGGCGDYDVDQRLCAQEAFLGPILAGLENDLAWMERLAIPPGSSFEVARLD